MPPFIVPQMPDQLKMLLKRPINGMNADAAPGSQPLSMPMAPNSGNTEMQPGTPGAPPATPAAQPSPIQPKPPTDDPGISGMPAVPKAPDMTQYLMPELQKIQQLEQQRAAVPAIDPQKVKPKLWERFVGAALGATQLKNPENAGAVADRVVHRGLYGAERDRNLALQPIDENLKAAREDFPVYSAAGEALQRNFQNQMETTKETREQFTAKSNSEFKEKLNEIRDMYDKGKLEDANNRLDEKQKELDQKKTHDAEWMQNQKELLDLRRMLIENKKDKENRGTPNQFAGAEGKKKQGIDKANSEYRKAIAQLDPKDAQGHIQASQQLQQDLQNSQDAYENEITALGGTAEHQTVDEKGNWKKDASSPASGAPTDKGEPKPVKSLNGHNVGDTVTLKGGKRVKITQLYSDGHFDHEPAK